MRNNNNNIPISAKWLLDSVGETGRSVINSVYLIFCRKTNSKGTGFLVKSGHIITNWHVVEDCSANEITAISSTGRQIKFQNIDFDENRDLAVLSPQNKLGDGLDIKDQDTKIGMQVLTWGYPLGYNGPAPLLAMGYLSGYRDHNENETSNTVKRYVINGAFNPGNSGGPLLISGESKVIGVVVTKHSPITPFLKSALKALINQKSGFVYTAKDSEGREHKLSEAQIIAEFLKHFHKITQVVIGEAIAGSELIAFLKENNIEF